MRQIPLTKGKFALVDDEDYDWLNQHKWFFSKYAKRAIGPGGKQKQLNMHRLIMNPPDNMEIDHINGNKLDNRRSNLRICTSLENQGNKPKLSHNKSGYKGVTFFEGKWRVYVRTKFCGYFKTKEEAAKAYNMVAKQVFGEFARLNDI